MMFLKQFQMIQVVIKITFPKFHILYKIIYDIKILDCLCVELIEFNMLNMCLKNATN